MGHVKSTEPTAVPNKLLTQTTDGGTEYVYTYGTSLTARAVTGTGTAAVISDPSTGQALDLQTTDGTTSLWITDGTGSPAAAIADTGNTAYTVSYDPYGAETVTTGGNSAQWIQNPYGFKNGIHSTSDNGLTKFGMRWQTSGTGGWIERDTFDVPLSPSNANRYAFAGDDPINKRDSTGRAVDWTQIGSDTTAGAVGLVAGAVFTGAIAGACFASVVCGFASVAVGAGLGAVVGNQTASTIFGTEYSPAQSFVNGFLGSGATP